MIIIKEATLNEAYFAEMFSLFEREKLPLQQWNDLQKKLWLQLVKDGHVDKNDVKTFFTFGKLFDDFYQKTGKIINYKNVIKNLISV